MMIILMLFEEIRNSEFVHKCFCFACSQMHPVSLQAIEPLDRHWEVLPGPTVMAKGDNSQDVGSLGMGTHPSPVGLTESPGGLVAGRVAEAPLQRG